MVANYEARGASNCYIVSREIGIDAGHRVTNHGSKCRHLHGHRYNIQAICEGSLFTAGEQEGMVLDFGFLKEEMMNEIHDPCDHGFLFWIHDELCWDMFRRDHHNFESEVYDQVARHGAYCGPGRADTKICILPFVPTAENLARFWFTRLVPRVIARSDGTARLVGMKVWETPNCWAFYGADADRRRCMDGGD